MFFIYTFINFTTVTVIKNFQSKFSSKIDINVLKRNFFKYLRYNKAVSYFNLKTLLAFVSTFELLISFKNSI